MQYEGGHSCIAFLTITKFILFAISYIACFSKVYGHSLHTHCCMNKDVTKTNVIDFDVIVNDLVLGMHII